MSLLKRLTGAEGYAVEPLAEKKAASEAKLRTANLLAEARVEEEARAASDTLNESKEVTATLTAREYIDQRDRLLEQRKLADETGSTDLSEKLTARIDAMKPSMIKVSESAEGFRTAAAEKLNEEVEADAAADDQSKKIKKFLDRLSTDLGAHPSAQADPSMQAMKDHGPAAKTGASGEPVFLYVGEMLVAVLTFSVDGTSVQAKFDDETDRSLINAYMTAKADFYDDLDEASAETVIEFFQPFGAAKNYKRADDFVEALSHMFGAYGFGTDESGKRSFRVREANMARLEAFMRREGYEINAVHHGGNEAEKVEAASITVGAADVEEVLDRAFDTHGGEVDVTFFRNLEDNTVSFNVGEFDGRGDKRKKDMLAKVKARANNAKASASVEKHFAGTTFDAGESFNVDEAPDATMVEAFCYFPKEPEMNEEMKETTAMKIDRLFGEELLPALEVEYRKNFPNGGFWPSVSTLGGEEQAMIIIKTTLISTREDFANGILQNDPVLQQFSITMRGEVLEFEKYMGSISVESEDRNRARGHVKLPFRKVKGDAKKIVASWGKYFAKVKGLVDANKSSIQNVSDIPARYFEDMSACAPVEEAGMTEEEAIGVAKKAMKADGEQKEALMAILKNSGYGIKEVDGKRKLVKKDGGKELAALEETVDAKGLAGAVKATVDAGMTIIPNSNKGNNGGPVSDHEVVLLRLMKGLRSERKFVMAVMQGNKNLGQAEVSVSKEGVSLVWFGKGDKTLDAIWAPLSESIEEAK